MNAKIFSFVKVSDDSMIASVRIARFLGKIVEAPIVWDESISAEPLDVLMIVNGAYAFAGSELLEALGAAIESAGRVVWVQNDYTIIPPKDESGAESPFRKAFRLRHQRGAAPIDYWTTVQTMSRPGRAPTGHVIGPGSQYVNWNALTLERRDPRRWDERVASETMIYYGAYRKDREAAFVKYFSEPHVPVLISCPNDKFRHFERCDHEERIWGDLYDYLGQFGLGLYIEDRRSHKEFHSPANRFYEMLSAGLPMVFEPDSMRQLEKAGYDVSQWVIWTAEDAPALMGRKQTILQEQSEQLWDRALKEHEDLPKIVRELWTKYC